MDFLVIEGNIGAGKTSLAKMISNEFNAQFVGEAFSDNPFLKKFYTQQREYAFTLEMSFMAERYTQLTSELQNRNLFKDFAVADYYFMKSLIFARVTLNNDEYNLYRKFFDIIYARLPRPNIYVYLHKNIDGLQKQIKNRGREYEKNISNQYLENIQDSYFNYMKQQNDFPVIIIDTNQVDFVNNRKDFVKICNVILDNSYNSGITRVLL